MAPTWRPWSKNAGCVVQCPVNTRFSSYPKADPVFPSFRLCCHITSCIMAKNARNTMKITNYLPTYLPSLLRLQAAGAATSPLTHSAAVSMEYGTLCAALLAAGCCCHRAERSTSTAAGSCALCVSLLVNGRKAGRYLSK